MRTEGPPVETRHGDLPAKPRTPSPERPPYRASLRYGAAYSAVFLVVATVRLLWMEDAQPVSLPHPAALVSGLVLAYGAGCLFALPLIWTLRRFRMSPRIPVLLWMAAVPISALGTVLGGLLGPPGILLLGGAPILAALGLAFAVQAIWTRRNAAAGDG